MLIAPIKVTTAADLMVGQVIRLQRVVDEQRRLPDFLVVDPKDPFMLHFHVSILKLLRMMVAHGVYHPQYIPGFKADKNTNEK